MTVSSLFDLIYTRIDHLYIRVCPLSQILTLVRNYTPAHEQIMAGDWNVAAVAKNAFDLEGKVVGTLGAGRIGFRVLQRIKPFNCAKLTYYDYAPLPKHAEEEVGAVKVDDLKQFLSEVGASQSTPFARLCKD